jgi:hypothetical protein
LKIESVEDLDKGEFSAHNGNLNKRIPCLKIPDENGWKVMGESEHLSKHTPSQFAMGRI